MPFVKTIYPLVVLISHTAYFPAFLCWLALPVLALTKRFAVACCCPFFAFYAPTLLQSRTTERLGWRMKKRCVLHLPFRGETLRPYRSSVNCSFVIAIKLGYTLRSPSVSFGESLLSIFLRFHDPYRMSGAATAPAAVSSRAFMLPAKTQLRRPRPAAGTSLAFCRCFPNCRWYVLHFVHYAA